MKIAILLSALFLSLVGSAAEHEWFKLETTIHYRDIARICTNEVTPNRLYLRVTLDGGRATEAVVKEGELAPLPGAPHTYFTAQERAGLAFDRDSRGRLWLSELTVSPRLLAWMLFNAASDCRPSQPLRSVSPERATLRFVRNESTQPFQARTERLAFSGSTVGGRAFSASVRMDESLIETP